MKMLSYDKIDGISIARYLKYFLQLKNQYVIYKLSVDKVQPKSLYASHKKVFDKLAEICNKYQIDAIKYVDFFVNHLNKFEKDIDDHLVNILTFKKYVECMQIKEKHAKIYKGFMKSVKNIVEDCIQLNYNSTLDYLRYLISSKKLSAYYASGKITAYYFAAIPKFRNVISKLDNISRDEFQMLYDRYDAYHADINEAFLRFKRIKVNPIKLTNDAIFNAKSV